MMKQGYRIGTGYDIHKLVEGRELIIGGTRIPHNKGLLGHSDADVLIHAIIDAMLGALALGDIGTFFPDDDPAYKNIPSIILLEKIYKKITEKQYQIVNIDSNIIAQEPKLLSYIPKMKEEIGKILFLDMDDISIKAKTNEELDAVGKREAIEANAAVLLYTEEVLNKNDLFI